MFAVSLAQKKLHPSDFNCLTKVFGFPILEEETPERTKVTVRFLPSKSNVTHGKLLAHEWKRQRIWNNEKRNEQIADLAEQFANHRFANLAKNKVITPGEKKWLKKIKKHLRVAVLVETPKHARVLKQLLPEFTVWDYRDPDDPTDEGVTPETGVITTQLAAHKGIVAQVVIRADGTKSPWNKRCGPHVIDPETPAPELAAVARMLIIDFADKFDANAIANAKTRRNNYGVAGLPVRPVSE
jgi:hypothetical protein